MTANDIDALDPALIRPGRVNLIQEFKNITKENAIEYIEIMTAGNASDFGDLFTGRYGAAASSDSHGGLGGY